MRFFLTFKTKARRHDSWSGDADCYDMIIQRISLIVIPVFSFWRKNIINSDYRSILLWLGAFDTIIVLTVLNIPVNDCGYVFWKLQVKLTKIDGFLLYSCIAVTDKSNGYFGNESGDEDKVTRNATSEIDSR